MDSQIETPCQDSQIETLERTTNSPTSQIELLEVQY